MATETTNARESADRRGVEGLSRRILEHGRESGQPVKYDDARKQAADIARVTDAQRKR